jgi:hypothetical protein
MNNTAFFLAEFGSCWNQGFGGTYLVHVQYGIRVFGTALAANAGDNFSVLSTRQKDAIRTSETSFLT